MVKTVVFPGLHFCSSVLQINNRNEYGSCLSDHLKNRTFCKNSLYGDFDSKFWPYLGKKHKNVVISKDFLFSSSVLMSHDC